MKSGVAVFAIAAFGFALPAAAQMNTSAFYAGVSIGQSKFKDFCEGSGSLGATCDDKDTAWKIFGGYQFTPNVAFELGYTDLGKASFSLPFGGGTLSGKGEATAFELVGVGSWPLAEAFSIYGKIGLYHGEAKTTASFGGSTSSDKDTGSEWTFGFGARYDFNRNIGVRGEWQKYNDFSGTDIDVLSLGVVYRFR
jgi:OmpA-OmpF porin, OOP family